MNFIDFATDWKHDGLININQLRLRYPTFNRSNLTNWVRKGYLLRMKNGWYCLSEMKDRIDFARYVSTRIYNPSYISLQTALSIYDIVPEAVVDFTMVTSMKTLKISNPIGNFYYYSIKPQLMFGYKAVRTPDGLYYMLATPEKAILDFLYLFPQYNTPEELENLRFDEVFMTDELNRQLLTEYLARFNNKALNHRVDNLLKLY